MGMRIWGAWKWGEGGGRRNIKWKALVLPKNDLQILLRAIDRNGRLTCERRKIEG